LYSVSVLPKVLVIDDDELVRAVICDLLRSKGCEVFEISSPLGVSRAIADHKIDVLLLDVLMPELSGDRLAKLLRSNPRMRELAIIFVSSAEPSELSRVATEVSADAVVPKAAIHTELATTVVSVFRRRNLERATQR
jgi:two-component system OmpR family response regulator